MKRPQQMRDFPNDQSRRNRSVVVAVQTLTLATVPFDPDVAGWNDHRRDRIRIPGPDNVSGESDDPLHSPDLWSQWVPIQAQ